MKTTLNISLSGRAFIIETDAHNELKSYFSQLRRRLGSNADADEIIFDIESRMAEHFTQRISNISQVVSIYFVKEVIGIIGDPSCFGDTTNNKSYKSYNFEGRFSSRRRSHRLMRDIDRGVLGGVCAGMASYLHADIFLIRLIVVILFLFGGLSLLIYIIAWIIIPAAVTPAERQAVENGHV